MKIRNTPTKILIISLISLLTSIQASTHLTRSKANLKLDEYIPIHHGHKGLVQSFHALVSQPDFENLSLLKKKNPNLYKYITEQLVPSVQDSIVTTLRVREVPRHKITKPLCEGAVVPQILMSMDVRADLVLIVTADEVNNPGIAWASACQYHALTSRPLVLRLNLKPSMMKNTPDRLNNDFQSVLKELLHTMAFSGFYLNLFLDPVKYTRKRRIDTLYSDYTNKIRNWIISPRVVAYARSYYQCPTLAAVPLQENLIEYNIHWHREWLGNELMTTGHHHNFALSMFTLAFFEETGWYQVRHDKADKFHWREKEGCNIMVINSACLYGDSNPCKVGEPNDTCYYDNTFVASCQEYPPGMTRDGNYFRALAYKNKCEFMRNDVFDTRDCRIKTTSKMPWTNQVGEYYGEGSRCITGNIFQQGNLPTSLCLKTSCIGNVLKFTIKNKELQCFGLGQRVTLDALGLPMGYISCPDTEEFCRKERNRCPKDCSRQGRCSSIGRCYCYRGFTGLGCQKVTTTRPYTDPVEQGKNEVIEMKDYKSKFFRSRCPKNCSSHGICSTKGVCICDKFYSGYFCQNFNVFVFFKKARITLVIWSSLLLLGIIN